MLLPVVVKVDNTPDEEPTVAIKGVELAHEPPVGVAVSVSVEDVQILVAPTITGRLLTVIGKVGAVPQPLEYEKVALPLAMPVTVPPVEIEAMAGLTLAHVPPVVPSVSSVVDPTHTVGEPEIATGALNVLTVVVPGAGQELTPFTLRVTLYVPATGE